MSKQYDEYLKEHRKNVGRALFWMYENTPELILNITVNNEKYNYTKHICKEHDLSKDSTEEYYAYDEYFYGDKSSAKENFNRAWLHHIHNNPHHWQYWVLINDDGGAEALDMPYQYIIEMICDWWSFSWKNDNLFEIFDWYNENKFNMILSTDTMHLVEKILNIIKQKLEAKYYELCK